MRTHADVHGRRRRKAGFQQAVLPRAVVSDVSAGGQPPGPSLGECPSGQMARLAYEAEIYAWVVNALGGPLGRGAPAAR